MSTATPQTYGSLVLSKSWHQPLQVFCKRLVDILTSAVMLVILSPLLLLLSAMVRFTSPGPVFYPWKVVGKNGKPFTGYKFRSMVANADQIKASLEAKNEMTGPVFKLTNDPRITPVGAWMRRYSLDELPQLYSVLVGDMSLVGPRPPLVTEYVRFSEYQKQKLAVTPGITCLCRPTGAMTYRISTSGSLSTWNTSAVGRCGSTSKFFFAPPGSLLPALGNKPRTQFLKGAPRHACSRDRRRWFHRRPPG